MKRSDYCNWCLAPRTGTSTCPECGQGYEQDRATEPLFLSPGTLLGDQYLIGRVLGHGGFGVTYLGLDTRLDIRLAIKEYLPRELVTRPVDDSRVRPYTSEAGGVFASGLQGFLQEAKTLAMFGESPNVVSVLNYFEANGTGYLVMRYIGGQDLDAYREACGGQVPQGDAVNLVIAVLDGLRAVHNAGLLHRDIKPQNVLLSDGGQIKLIDFGAARFAAAQHSRSLTQIWTPGYAPFEQCYSGGKQGPWTDIYGAGATLYRLLTGAELPESVAVYTGDAVLASPRELVGNMVSEAVSDVVMKAMAPRGADRYQTVQAFLAALQGATNVRQVEPPPPPPPLKSAPPPEPISPHGRVRRGPNLAEESEPDSPSAESDLLDGFRDNGDGTITDTVTGLVWQQGDSNQRLTWADAKTYAAGLELGGYSDWRLPDKTELKHLYDRLAKLANGKDDRRVAPFRWTIRSKFLEWLLYGPSYYWSSSTYASSTSRAWSVSCYGGYVSNGSKADSSYARCVRR